MQTVIFDMDDTLTHAEWRSHLLTPKPGERKKDWASFFSACDQDPPNQNMLQYAAAITNAGGKIVIFTGRPRTYEEKTKQWLIQHGVQVELIKMREPFDFKPSAVMKLRWLHELQKKGFSVVGAFDDELKNIDAFNNEGIPCVHPQDQKIQEKFEGILRRVQLARPTPPPRM